MRGAQHGRGRRRAHRDTAGALALSGFYPAAVAAALRRAVAAAAGPASGGGRLTEAFRRDGARRRAPGARDPRPAAARLRDPGGQAARSPDRRADPDRPVAVDQRPQPRRRLLRPARALLRAGQASATRRSTRSRRRSGRAGSRRSSRRGSSRSCGRSRETAPDARAVARLAGRTQTVPEAQEYLSSLPGVGRKTAACVLLFALGMRDVPVDTHVSRVGTRLGLFRPGAPFVELHDEMLAITPRGRGAGAPPQPAAPRPPDLPRAASGMHGLRAGAHVPERRNVRLTSRVTSGKRTGRGPRTRPQNGHTGRPNLLRSD